MHAKHKDELPTQKRQRHEQKHALTPSERITQSQTGEARQQREVLVKRKEGKHGCLPPDDRQFQKETQSRRSYDGGPDPTFRKLAPQEHSLVGSCAFDTDY